ncbi:MAG TPA: APC family permease [Anaerolineales bacterium]|nr:APC family permease [Anaerolineales bacterium]
MATMAATAEVFTRKASGLVRVMSPYSAFIYNILTMGLIFPWTYLWAPGALPGGKLVWGILLATLLEIPIAFAYVWLSTALPRSGGDYVFQSRAFGGFWGFTLLMSGFVIWILQWVALSGWLLAYLGFAPLFLGLGATLGNPALSGIGVWFTSANGIIIVSILNAAVSAGLLVSGFKNYVKVQYVMFYAILVAFATTLIVLFTTPTGEFAARINAFAAASGGAGNWYQTARDAVVAAGVDLNPPFSLLATLLVAPIAWTSLQWATYSAEQNGEIKEARSFKNQAFILVGSLIVTGLLLAILALAFERAGGSEFVYIAGAGYWSLVGEATISGFNLWPNILAVALTASPIVVILIGLGYILNSFQIVCNCYIGVTRIMVAMSLDRLLPEWFSRVHERLHTPVNAHLAYFIASLPVIWAYNKVGGWIGLTLGVTFACGYVFAASSLAGAVLPFRAKEVYEASPGSAHRVNGWLGLLLMLVGAAAFVWTTWVFADVFSGTPILLWLVRLLGILAVLGLGYMFRGQLGGWFGGQSMPWVTALGTAGAGFGFAMVVAFLLAPQLGVLGNWDFSNLPSSLWAQIIAFGILLMSAVWYLLVKNAQRSRGINVDFAFKEVPPE